MEIAGQIGSKAVAQVVQARAAGPAIVDEAKDHRCALILVGMVRNGQQPVQNLGKSGAYVLTNAPCRVWLVQDPKAMFCRRERNMSKGLVNIPQRENEPALQISIKPTEVLFLHHTIYDALACLQDHYPLLTRQGREAMAVLEGFQHRLMEQTHIRPGPPLQCFSLSQQEEWSCENIDNPTSKSAKTRTDEP